MQGRPSSALSDDFTSRSRLRTRVWLLTPHVNEGEGIGLITVLRGRLAVIPIYSLTRARTRHSVRAPPPLHLRRILVKQTGSAPPTTHVTLLLTGHMPPPSSSPSTSPESCESGPLAWWFSPLGTRHRLHHLRVELPQPRVRPGAPGDVSHLVSMTVSVNFATAFHGGLLHRQCGHGVLVLCNDARPVGLLKGPTRFPDFRGRLPEAVAVIT